MAPKYHRSIQSPVLRENRPLAVPQGLYQTSPLPRQIVETHKTWVFLPSEKFSVRYGKRNRVFTSLPWAQEAGYGTIYLGPNTNIRRLLNGRNTHTEQ